MRYCFLLLYFISTASFAISCPNNGTQLNTGMTLEKILVGCGQPTSMNKYTVDTNRAEQWIYYSNQHHQKITFLFNNNHIKSINIFNNNPSSKEEHLSSVNLCGRHFKLGNGLGDVHYACGEPEVKEVLQKDTIQVSELTYPGTGPNILIVENGKLTDWKYQSP